MTAAHLADPAWSIFTEDWDPAYGAPATFDLDAPDGVEPAEPDTGPVAGRPAHVPIAFVDGRRRAELSLWLEHAPTGVRIPGLAGAYAVGAVTIRPGRQAAFSGIRVGRVVVWGAGANAGDIRHGGYTWAAESVASGDPEALLARLQDRMRAAEGELALDSAARGWTTVLDGPLNRIRAMHELAIGYVKTHRRQILPDDDHRLVPRLAVGQRTRLYTAGSDRYTCYVRVGSPGPGGSPWSGIARLDFPAVAGLDAVAERADLLAGTLPAYAGAPHRDPRAPVNLTPVRNLEANLARQLGRVELATRAARTAVISGATR